MNQEQKDKIIEGVLKNPHYLENSSDLVSLIDIVSNLTEQELKSEIGVLIDHLSRKQSSEGNIKLLKELKEKIQSI